MRFTPLVNNGNFLFKSEDFLRVDLEAQSGSIWTEEKNKGPKKEKKYIENIVVR